MTLSWTKKRTKKRPKTVHTRGCARFISKVHRRETVEKQRFRSFVHREKAREPYETVVLYGLFIRCTVEQKRCCTFSLRRVELHSRKNVQRGTAPNRTVGFRIFKTAPNRTVGYITAPNSTVGFNAFQNRTKPHRKISAFLKPHRTGR